MLNINFNPFPVLETERLNLRKLKLEDENEIFKIRSNPEIAKYLDRPLYKSIDEAKKFINMISEGIENNESIYWVITLKGGSKLIGTICLWQINHELEKAEIGFELMPEYQGKGFMFEAAAKVIEFGFSKMNLKTIEGEIDPGNYSSIKLMEKFNFTKVKEIRETDPESVVEGKTIMYSLTQS